jgi:hypothetical protein
VFIIDRVFEGASRSPTHIAWPQRPKGIHGPCKLLLARWHTPMQEAMNETP